MSYKIDVRANKVTRDREEHYMVIKGSIQQKAIIILKYMHRTTEVENNVKHKLIELKTNEQIHNYSWTLKEYRRT